MFDNVAFEVVIGLVFIYLLYSLLVTILGEIISTFLGIRARLLRAAIERMLNDGYYFKLEKEKNKNGEVDKEDPGDTKEFTWRRGPVLTQHPDFKKSFAGKFYDYPAIKYLGRIETARKEKLTLSKPSYISADYFADSLINFLADKGAGSTLMDKVGFCLQFNTYHIQPNTRRQFVNLYESSASIESYKANLMKWFNETMDRTSGWHKRKMRVISFSLGLALAMAFNIDTIKIAKILANDKEARAQLVDMGVAVTKDSARYKEFVTDNGDTLHSQAILDTGFARLKNDINAASTVLGLGWDLAGILTEDDIEIDSKDAAFPKLRQYADSLKTLHNRREYITTSLRDSLVRLAINKQQLDSIYADTTIAINEAILGAAGYGKDSNARFIADIENALLLERRREIIKARLKIDSAALSAHSIILQSLYSAINRTAGRSFTAIDSASQVKGAIRIYGKRPYSAGEKTGYILSHIFWFSLVGFIITALALSMGAPFWFDLLNKLVSIRGVGVKPEEKKTAPLTDVDKAAFQKDGSPQNTENIFINKAPDAVEAALRLYDPQLKTVPGVKAVFSVMVKGSKQLQVNVADGNTKKEVERLFPEMKYGEMEIPFKVVVCGTPFSQAGSKGVITNASGQNGFGSLSCIVKRTATQSKHILSCWHVLKGDFDYSSSDSSTRIIDRSDDSHLAERWAGGIRAQFDYGFARCTEQCAYQDNSFLTEKLHVDKLRHRVISQADIDNQIEVKFYNALTNKITKGFIHTDTAAIDINYIDKTRIVTDVLILTSEDETTISQEGNSGSLVLDKNNVAIGMIIGGDLKYTYAVKLSHVFKLHQEMEMA